MAASTTWPRPERAASSIAQTMPKARYMAPPPKSPTRFSGGTGGPSDSTLFYTLYLYQRGFGLFDMGYASAMAWLLLMIIGGFTAVNFLASKYWVFYGD